MDQWRELSNHETERSTLRPLGPLYQAPNTTTGTIRPIFYDQGFPTDGYELAYGKDQFVLVYDSAKVPEPPKTIGELVEWIKANPGKFTYSAPPDFTGTANVRHFFYWYGGGGGNDIFMGDFDEELYLEKSPALWGGPERDRALLWREGETYPENLTQMVDLFANSEIDLYMAFGPNDACDSIERGQFPETARPCSPRTPVPR